jgi:glyoxylase-like metal-dependent hydrolase (beta-lactamase superfamily II)/rhodanese-related sulfurtransferase
MLPPVTDPIVESLGPAACRSYLVACPRTLEAAVVDPLEEDVPRVLEHAARSGYRIAAVLDTHTHADHRSGGAAMAAATGAPYALHESTGCARVTERLRDGQSLAIGDLEVRVLHTPGHTPDSATFACGRLLFTGDFLFLAQDGAGRLDLPGGDAGAHWDSLQRLAALGDDQVVLPGHDYVGMEPAPLGEERRRNPRFQSVTRDEYVAWQRAIAQPTPDWMLDVIAANLGTGAAHAAHHGIAHAIAGTADGAACTTGGACLSSPTGRVPLVTVHEAARRMGRPAGERPFLLDVREPHEFHGPTGRHAPGAVLVPLATLPQRLAALPADPSAEILVICKSGGRSARAAEFLIESGRRRVFNVTSGTDGWVAAGLPVER